MAFVDQKHNTKTSRNSYSIIIFQGDLPYELYFIAINNWGQVIIGPNKKTVATYMVGELKVLIWFMRTWMLKWRYCYDQYLLVIVWTRVKSNDDMISYTTNISVSASCSRCNDFTWFSYSITHLLYRLYIVSLWIEHIYSIDTILYSLCFTNWLSSYSFFKPLSKLQPELSLRL